MPLSETGTPETQPFNDEQFKKDFKDVISRSIGEDGLLKSDAAEWFINELLAHPDNATDIMKAGAQVFESADFAVHLERFKIMYGPISEMEGLDSTAFNFWLINALLDRSSQQIRAMKQMADGTILYIKKEIAGLKAQATDKVEP